MAVTKEQVMEALKQVYDLEVGFDVVSLGLVYGVEVDNENNVKVFDPPWTPDMASDEVRKVLGL